MRKIKSKPVSKQELREIIQNSTSGIIFIESPSGGGKTYLLKKLRETSGRQVRLISYETVSDKIMALMRDCSYTIEALTEAFSAEILCIEDVDFLNGKEQMQAEFASLANVLSENCLVIFTGIKLSERLPHLFASVSDFRYYNYKRE